MRFALVLSCLAMLFSVGCKNKSAVEAEPASSAMEVGQPADTQAVLVPEPEVNDDGFVEPYATRNWGADPVGGSSTSTPTPETRMDRSQPGPTVEARPQVIEPVTPLPVATPETHIVRKGDTLWSIAQQHYGDGKRWQDIAEANPGIVPEKLAVDQTLVLP